MQADEFQRLVEEITDAVFCGLRGEAGGGPCACHAVAVEQCPDRMRLILECGADRLGTRGPCRHPVHADLARYIDHTLLKPDATEADILALCDEALRFGFASVCVNPAWVPAASARLRGSAVAVCSVAGFPLGATPADVKGYEARRALFDGAREIDMVIHVGALKSGRDDLVRRDIESVVEACRGAGALAKVIIETALLADEEKVRACLLARDAGADFVKTSTGFASGGATVEDILLMRRTVGAHMGIKASGGVRDTESTRRLIAAGATRIGASAGVRIVQGESGAAAY